MYADLDGFTKMIAEKEKEIAQIYPVLAVRIGQERELKQLYLISVLNIIELMRSSWKRPVFMQNKVEMRESRVKRSRTHGLSKNLVSLKYNVLNSVSKLFF
jgi:hypothetical protein